MSEPIIRCPECKWSQKVRYYYLYDNNIKDKFVIKCQLCNNDITIKAKKADITCGNDFYDVGDKIEILKGKLKDYNKEISNLEDEIDDLKDEIEECEKKYDKVADELEFCLDIKNKYEKKKELYITVLFS